MPRFTHTDDVARGDWIRRRLTGASGSVTGVVPAGFPHYLRLFHPIELGGQPATWRDWCRARDRRWHALMQWHALDPDCDDQRDHRHPWEGALDVANWSVLADLLDDPETPVTAGLWNGYGHLATPGVKPASIGISAWSDTEELSAVREPDTASLVDDGWITDFDVDVHTRPQLGLPGRGYVLFTGRLATLRDPAWRERSGWAYRWPETVNLLWPDDHRWCVATEIDFDTTLIGCGPELAAWVLASGLEVAEVDPDDSLQYDADRLNGPPRGLR